MKKLTALPAVRQVTQIIRINNPIAIGCVIQTGIFLFDLACWQTGSQWIGIRFVFVSQKLDL